ncbi:MAG: abhydrolase domain-containing 18 [Chloroflexi bacterium]|nr:abhydrolase domain-containing 18 [Chloroflexota bacterium]
MNPYDYHSGETCFNLALKETSSKWLRYVVDFPTAHPTQYEENNTACGEYFQPRNANNAPLAILIHGWGDRSIIPCRFLARALVKKGIACFMLYLVFHTSRMPEVIKSRLPLLTPDEWFEGYRVSVIEIRQIIDWASKRAEINENQIGVVGISMGGFISSIAMGVDKRIKAGVFIVSGGNSERITWDTKNEAIIKGHSCTQAECHEIHNHYPQYVTEVDEKGFENVTPLIGCFQTDPLTFAPFLRKRPILMINALWDEAIPRQATLDFWEACDKPAILWLPGTHVTVWLWYPIIQQRTAGFLTSAFTLPSRCPK